MHSTLVIDRFYYLAEKKAAEENKTVGAYLDEVIAEAVKIVPTKEERKEWKGYLYNRLCSLAVEIPKFKPRKRDSINTLLELFTHYIDEYCGETLAEEDEANTTHYANTSRYCAWLIQEYENRHWAKYKSNK